MVGVDVLDGVEVWLGVDVEVAVGVKVLVLVGVAVLVLVGVAVLVGVCVGVAVKVLVGVIVRVLVGVAVLVLVGVGVLVGVVVRVGNCVAKGSSAPASTAPKSQADPNGRVAPRWSTCTTEPSRSVQSRAASTAMLCVAGL